MPPPPDGVARWPRSLVALSLAVGVWGFLYRFLTFRGLTNDQFMHMAWAHQLLLGELPGRDFVEPGMPLSVALTAATQWLWPGPLSEAILGMCALALAATLASYLTGRLTGSLMAAAAAGLITVAVDVRFYSYPKVLVPVVAVLLVWCYSVAPGRRWLVAAGVWTGVAALLRHDLAVYAAPAVATGLAMVHWPHAKRMMRVVAVFLLVAVLTLLPYAAYVQWAEGIAEHLRVGVEFSRTDAQQLIFELAPFPVLAAGNWSAWGSEDSAAVLFYLGHLLVPLGALILWWRGRAIAGAVPAIVTALLLLSIYDVAIMRHSRVVRVPDAITLLAPLGLWATVELMRLARRSHLAVAVGAIATALTLSGSMSASVWQLGGVSEEIDNTGISRGWGTVREIAADKFEMSREWPWPRLWPQGPLPETVRYLAACTAPEDHVLVTWNAPEYYFFARRRFAAGHGLLLAPNSFATERDQTVMLERLSRQRVPIVFIQETARHEFVEAYPRLDAHLRREYRPVGTFVHYEGSEITIAWHKGIAQQGTWEETGWPCAVSQRSGAGATEG